MNNDIIEALQIMLIGMGVVVLFLIILVFVMKLVSSVVAKLDKLMPVKQEEISSPSTTATQSISNDKMIAIAIALAHVHSNKSK